MRYMVKRIVDIARFFVWWRLLLLAVSVVLAVLAVTADSGAGWLIAAAAAPAIVLYGIAGARTSANHAEINRLRTVAKSSSDGPAAAPAIAVPQPEKSPASDVRPREMASSIPPGRSARPDVTIVVTAFNEHDYIVDCLESIRLQTWRNFQCIVVDDRSTDDTLELSFDRFSQDGRFEFIAARSNAGLSTARNIGTAVARAPWITFVDGDDFLFEEAIEHRLRTLATENSNPWIAGAYCNWISVPQTQERTATGRNVPARPRITWLDTLHDAPFIASAPIVRTAIVRAMGGFRNVNAAEDADMWTKVLRHGYVFLPTHYTGIAYRQKANSMFRVETVEHASVTVGLYVSNYEPKPLDEFAPDAPFAFHEAAPTYITAAESFRRNLIALTTAVAQDDTAAIDRLAELLDTADSPFLPWAVDVDRVVFHAAKRAESYDDVGVAARAEVLSARTRTVLASRIHHVTSPAASPTTPANTDTPAPTRGEVDGTRWARLQERRCLHLDSDATGSILAGHIVLIPSAAYHVEELGPLAEALSRRGLPVGFMVSDRRWAWTEPGLRAWDYPVYDFPDDMEWIRQVAGIVTLNDWAKGLHEVIVAANEFGVPTFGKVEGVQDFGDVDVHWQRNAYQTAAHTLCQGSNDVASLPEEMNTHVVGSSRLEDIWRGPPRRVGPELAVVNLNFTYGVLEESRRMWVDTVLEAGQRTGIEIMFSLHPAEKQPPEGAAISDLPIRHLLTQASVLISRFSTVPFEAMARGVPFIYHNPHGEGVPTFLDPKGAFEVSTTAEELASAIRATRTAEGSYRAKCERFFRQQIDIDPATRSADRAAKVIHDIVTDD